MIYDWGTERAKIIDDDDDEMDARPLGVIMLVLLAVVCYCGYRAKLDYDADTARTAAAKARLSQYLYQPVPWPRVCPPGAACSTFGVMQPRVGVMPPPPQEITEGSRKYRWDSRTSTYKRVWDI